MGGGVQRGVGGRRQGLLGGTASLRAWRVGGPWWWLLLLLLLLLLVLWAGWGLLLLRVVPWGSREGVVLRGSYSPTAPRAPGAGAELGRQAPDARAPWRCGLRHVLHRAPAEVLRALVGKAVHVDAVPVGRHRLTLHLANKEEYSSLAKTGFARPRKSMRAPSKK